MNAATYLLSMACISLAVLSTPAHALTLTDTTCQGDDEDGHTQQFCNHEDTTP